MAKINILPQNVYNRIAAGEVVDRPYSVVKELVENAIDAKATEIEIEIVKGGKELISVSDNGCGIAREDLPLAFLPHATSKIEKASDLESIMTLGFRGEAVASIASVSKMTIVSKVNGKSGYSLTSDGGTLGEIKEASANVGTVVNVESLFFNTPVRLGFLKSDKAEEADIIQYVSRFILCHSEIAFKLVVNKKTVLQSFGDGDEEAFLSVYGASALKNCYSLQAEKHGIRIRGYIGNQNYSKPNKSYQSVFLNGRYIVNQTVATAIMNAYQSYLMKRQYPFYVLHIDVPSEIVDVNVHPNKADVRFADNRIVFGCIYNVISSVLDGNSSALNYVDSIENNDLLPVRTDESESKKTENAMLFTYADAKKEMDRLAVKKEEKNADLPFEVEGEKKVPLQDEKAQSYFNSLKKEKQENFEKQSGEKESELNTEFPDLFFDEKQITVKKSEKMSETDVFEANKLYLNELEKSKKQNKIDVASLSYAGKLFNTYLIFEHGDEFYIIDQHAAHERLIFNRLKARLEERKPVSQPMLLSYNLNVSPQENAYLSEHLDVIRSLGFEIDEFGQNSYKISAVPCDLQDMDIGAFFADILSDISGLKAIRLDDILKDKLAMAACKAAVKGGMDLSQAEIEELMRLMDGDMGLKCPHGRPVVVKMTKSDLEKMFKRIV